jgi:uncharacterized metal-binding protein
MPQKLESPPQHPGCTECHLLNCYRREKTFPGFCLTVALPDEVRNRSIEHYKGNGLEARIAYAAADVEGTYYGQLTRIEEIVAFANRIGAKKIGIATCIGLIEESRIFAKVLMVNQLDPYSVICKIGGVDKTAIGIPEAKKVAKGKHESLCNPVLQAELLNKHQTDLNVMVGLCVGHDSLFFRHSNAPVTVLSVKDRVLGHNPLAALYTSGFYYKRLFEVGRSL